MSNEDFLEKMLNKCEVSSFQQVYEEIVKKNKGIIKCNQIFKDNPKYNLNKIKDDILPIQSLLYIELYKYNYTQNSSEIRQEKIISFEKIPYICNIEGFERVLLNYKQKGYISTNITFKELNKIWNIQDNCQNKLREFILDFVNRNHSILKIISKNGENILHFYSFLEKPDKKKSLLQLLGVLMIFLILLILLLRFVNF